VVLMFMMSCSSVQIRDAISRVRFRERACARFGVDEYDATLVSHGHHVIQGLVRPSPLAGLGWDRTHERCAERRMCPRMTHLVILVIN